ncbi:PIG-L family deacetylase [Nordella sp. HKS 07]|nr:PIG-L family deacetylase [Nordella sp. HKS 07]
MHLPAPGTQLSLLCLGAHSDDIEIGIGATVLGLIAQGINLKVYWCVLSGSERRAVEAEASAKELLLPLDGATVEILQFRDGHFPESGIELKAWFESIKVKVNPDLIFTHRRDDAHQDHREVCRLTWNTFRDHCILEYEIPKWDGDIGQPNLYVPATRQTLEQKIDLLLKHFGSQRSKHWFDAETFRALARLRGLECRAPEGYAEAFFARKLVLA